MPSTRKRRKPAPDSRRSRTTLGDATRLKRAERDERAAREQAAEDLRRMTRLHELSIRAVGSSDVNAMLDRVVRAALDITGADSGDIQWCDQVDRQAGSTCGMAMATRRRVIVEDVTTSPIFAGTPALAVLAPAGARAVQSTPLFGRSDGFLGVFSTYYRDVHHFDEGELRWLDLLARHAADIMEQHLVGERLAQTRRELEARVADRTRWLLLMHSIACEINAAPTWDEALHRVLRRLCHAEDWQIGLVYMPTADDSDDLAPVVSYFRDERLRAFHELTWQLPFARGEFPPGCVFLDGTPRWAVDSETLLKMLPARSAAAAAAGLRAGAAFPIAVRGEVVAVLELFSCNAHRLDEQLSSLMQDVGPQIGLVLQRERATARMADLVWREQQELLHTLHDSLGQTLTGLGMLSMGLRQRLQASNAEASDAAAEIVQLSQQALDQVRLLAKSLFPIEVDAESLMVALRGLALATESLHKIQVRVEGAAPQTLRDGKVATELYRIAQEAVTNSVKHARAKTITIGLEGASGLTRLRIADDGIGIRHPEPADGAGLRIMRHRAASIGAMLAVERGTAAGTVVTCTLRQPLGSHEVMT